MLIDKQNQFSDAQAVTSTGSTASTNIVDLGVARDIGGAVTEQLMLLCQVVTAFTSGDDGVAYERRIEAVLTKLESLPVATIAAAQGYVVGGGLAIAAACDLRVCTPDAYFGVPIAKTVGNCLSTANYARLVASLGAARTKALLFTADFMSSDEARALGFVVSVIEPNAFDAELDALCDRIATYAPITLQVTREAIRRIVGRSLADGDDLVRRAYESSDFHEGVTAFLEKRPPRWEGR